MARESKDSIRERLLNSAEQRFWQYGLKKTTIDEIAADADVGKGTVYLHFDSKEDIGVAIIARYKQASLAEQEAVASEVGLLPVQRLRELLLIPVRTAAQHCRSPLVCELIAEIRPRLKERVRSLVDREVELIRATIEDGNRDGSMHVEDPAGVALMLKNISYYFMPLQVGFELPGGAEFQLNSLIDIIYQGLR
jgi:AcrR family transcriptional regulator